MFEGPTIDTWRARLEARGHRLSGPTWRSVLPFSLWPSPDTIITVAVEPDGAMYRRFRQRFFLCDPDPDTILRRTGCLEPHRGHWLGVVSWQPPGAFRDFLAGQGSWLLSRLVRFRQVVAWADRGLPWDRLDDPFYRKWDLVLPAQAAPFFAVTAGPEANRPRLLPVGDGRFADAVAACVLFAVIDCRDCFLADESGGEAYLAHHHEKIVVSVPDAQSRERLLRDLRDPDGLFTDVSDYGSSFDEADDEC